MTGPVQFRGHRRGDLARLPDLIAHATPRDPVSEDWLAEYLLLDPNFDPDGLIVAEEEGTGRLVGFVHAVRGGEGVGVDPDGGWITIGGVLPDVRGNGIGTELLRRAKAFLAAKGARWGNYSAYPLAYFLPGLDREAYPEGAALLERGGFRRLYTAAAMTLDLDAYVTPPAVHELVRTRVEQGYTFATADHEDLPEVIRFASAALAPDWGAAVRESVLRHGRRSRVLLARNPAGAVVGFATYGAYRGVLERFGPFGVDETCRGTGLGRILLHRTLVRMRAEGAHTAWFLWTGEHSPAGHLYLSSGFRVVRRFDVLRCDLTD